MNPTPKKNKSNRPVSDLSPHLFWDVDQKEIDWKNDAAFIVERILQYGVIEDWAILVKKFGIPKIADLAKKIRSLDPVSHNFIAVISDTPLNEFRCYTERQSNPTLWNS